MCHRPAAAWDRLCAELGRVFGEMVAAQEACAEKDAEIADLRQQLARSQDEIQKREADQ